MLAYCETIRDVVKSSYPAAYEVWKEAPQETISFLKAKGILEAHELDRSFDMPFKEGTDNIQAWQEYKTAIYDYLTLVNDDVRLKRARQDLANEIWVEHYKKFPRWPSSGSQQSDWVSLDRKQKYTDGDWIIFWSAGGSIRVTDDRPSSYTFKARFAGKPTLRVLKVDYKRFAKFNALCAKDKQGAIEHVKKNATAALTWDSL